MTTCPKHPDYMAVRPPTADCEPCRQMYAERHAPGAPMMALSLRVPFAEQVLEGTKTIEYRSIPTNKRERVFVYEAKGDGDGRGLIVGTVEIVGCREVRDERTSDESVSYEWDLANPERILNPMEPVGHPQPVFFDPFPAGSVTSDGAAPALDATIAQQKQDAVARRIARLEDDLRIARTQRDNSEKRMHQAERIRDEVFNLAEAPLVAPEWMVERSAAGDAPHTAVLVTSDFQWGEVIRPDNVDGINEFNVEIAQARYRTLIEKTIELSFEHLAKNKYDGITVLRLGDTVSGDIHQELRETNELSGLMSVPSVAESETWGLRKLADEFGRVHVVSVPGNHGRTTLKPPTKNVEENYDWLASCWIERELKGDGRFTWQTPRAADAVFELHGRLYLATHGDRIGTSGGKGFVGSLAPISRGATLTLRQYAQRGINVSKMFMGHYHESFDFGRGWSNGSLPGYSELAFGGRMNMEPPQQWLIYMHPKYGDTSCWKVRV